MIKLSPSILSADFSNLAHEVQRVEKAGVEYLHIDVMDGHFVPNITIGPLVIQSLRDKTSLFFDVHLMIDEPDRYIPQFAEAGADLICVHVEATNHIHRTIELIKSLGKKAAVAVNPGTPIEQIDPILPELDMVLIMTVNPGFGGQSFIQGTLSKISALRKKIMDMGLTVDIEVDGGIKPDNVSEVIKAGANVIVSGSAIFLSEDLEQTVRLFREKGETL